MKILVIDIGGSHVKMLASGATESVRTDSGPSLTPQQMVEAVKAATSLWQYDVITIGVPTPVVADGLLHDPVNLGGGWVGYDFGAAFGKPVRLINDAAMQALGSYDGGRMLFLGLGTGLGSAVVHDGMVMPLELGHLPFRKATYEYYLGSAGLERAGKKVWERRVHVITNYLRAAMVCDTVVLGGGNSKVLKTLPEHALRGDNANAFVGGFRMWEGAAPRAPSAPQSTSASV